VASLSAYDQPAWELHTIDSSSRGADGVRLGDVDQDGRLDIATGWEEGGRIRICFQPAVSEVRQQWPSIQVGEVKSPEDAVFADVNHDGWLDVVSCCEGNQQAVFFHINPGRQDVRNPDKWQTKLLAPTHKLTRWMFCQPFTSPSGTQQESFLILGSKNPAGTIARWNLTNAQPDNRLLTLRSAGWIMSLRRFDVDADGDDDLVFSDRKGMRRGIGWLENTGPDSAEWPEHPIGGTGLEVMFLDLVRHGDQTLLACNTRNGHIQLLEPGQDIREPWTLRKIAHPAHSGAGKAVAIGDLDDDGTLDLACTCGLAKGKLGAYWLSEPGQPQTNSEGMEQWTFHDISGVDVGSKFDRIELIDLDQDGDLDLLTCEERDNLGVIWYQNPRR
jgi:hypothetical protein